MAETLLEDGVPQSEVRSEIYDEDGYVAEDFLDRVRAAIEAEDAEFLRERVGRLHESELGDLLSTLNNDQRQTLVRLMGEEFDYTALTEVDEAIRLSIVDAMPNEQVAEALRELDSDDAVYILEDLEEDDRKEILAQLPFRERLRLRRSLEYPRGIGRPAHADGVRRGAAVLDRRPDHRLHARGGGPAGILRADLRHRSDLQAARRRRPRPDPQRQAPGEDRGHHARDAPCDPGRDGPGGGGADHRAVRPALGRGHRFEREAGRYPHHRRRHRHPPAGGRRGHQAPRRRRRRRDFRYRAHRGAVALPVAARQSGDGDPRLAGHRALRRDHPADGGARRPDADRRLDGRQRRHADHDGRGARARGPRDRHLQCRPHRAQGGAGRPSQRRALRGPHRRGRLAVVRETAWAP